jgi:iron complex outermembrane receptor protein
VQAISNISRYSLLLIAASIPAVATAQMSLGEAATGSSANNQNSGLAEIVVTAQRRGENLQKVPIAISAVTSDMAEAMGVKGTQDIGVVAPAVTFNQTASGGNVQIRGVGASGSAADETANAIYIDGVYQAAAPTLALPLNNIQRIEVAKGPQGTLFGRNSTGGVIQIITRDPPTEPRADISFGYGNYETVETQAYVGSGLATNLAGDVALYYSNQQKGWGTNLVTGKDAYQGRNFSGRTKLRWTPSEQTTVTLSASHVDMQPVTAQGGSIFPGQFTRSAGGVAGSSYPGFYNLDHNSSDEKHVKQNQVSSKIEHEFDWARLVNIASYSKTKHLYQQDNDIGRANVSSLEIHQEIRTITEEIQLLSASGSPVTWAVGFFYLNNTNGLLPLIQRGLSLGSPTAQAVIRAKSKTDSYALYGQATVPIAEATNITAGLRYTIDERSIRGTTTLPTGTVVPASGDARDKKLTWRLSLDHQFTPALLGYASYNRGYKGGFYNITAPNQVDVGPEVIDAYEGGFKSQLFENRLRFNLSAFYYDFKGIQVRTGIINPVGFLNAASARLKGVDIDIAANPFRNLTIQGGLSYLDASYRKFDGAPIFTPNPAGGFVQTFGSADGNRAIQSPKWIGSLAGDYKIPIGSGAIGLSSSLYYNSGYYFDPQNRINQSDFVLLNAALSWTNESERLEVRLWGRNLTTTHYRTTVATSALGDQGFPGAPRTYGVTLRTRF